MRGSAAVFAVSATSYASMLLAAVRGILVMRIIGPTGRGIMQSVNLFVHYLSHAHLGILDGLSKELPVTVGEGDYEQADRIESVGMTWVITLTAVAGLGLAIWGMGRPTGKVTTGVAIAIGGGWLLAQQTYMLYRCVIRSWGNFKLLAWVTLVEGIAALGLTVYGALYWDVVGAMAGMLLAWLMDLAVMHFFSGVRIRPSVNPELTKYLFRVGILILMIKFSDLLLRSVESMIIIRYYEAYRFGLYSVGMQMARYMFAIPESAGFVIWPKIMEKWGGSDDLEQMRRHVEMPTITSATVMPFLAGSATVLLPALIMLIIPKFAPSIQPATVLLWGGIFLALPLATNSLLVATDRELTVVGIRLVSAIALGGAAYWLVSRQAPLEHIAAAAALAYALASVLSLGVVLPNYFSGMRLLGEFAVCYLPTAWAIGAVVLSEHLTSQVVIGGPKDLLYAGVKLVLFAAMYLPVLVYANYRTDLWHEILLFLRLRAERDDSGAADYGDDDDGQDT